MKSKLLIVACFAAAVSVYAAAPSFTHRAAAQDQKIPGKNAFTKTRYEDRKPVPFDHEQHLAFSSCLYCHHTSKGLTLDSFKAGKAEKVPLCYSCHMEEGNAKNPKNKAGEEVWAKPAYHVNCIDCHKDEITKQPEGLAPTDIKKKGSGPTKCTECHEKKD